MKLKINKILLCIKSKIHLFIFLLSLLSITFILFKIVNLNIILGISEILPLEFLFQTIIIFSTIYTILFLPTYPIFFYIIKAKFFNFPEKLSLTIVINSVFYILVGYIGYYFGFPITELFFFYTLIISFFSIFTYIIFHEFRKDTLTLSRFKESIGKKNRNSINFSLIKYLKNAISLNTFLLIFFIFLICILNIVRVSYFAGTDSWLHILNNRIITDINYLPLVEYHGTLGLNISGSIIHFFSGLDHILIPRYSVFYTFFVSALIFYNILMRIFRNKNLAYFGVFMLEFSSLGFSTMMLQYWPSGSTLIKLLMIFFLLYVRLQNFVQLERPTKKIIFSNIFLIYILITLIFITAVLTHVITSIIFLFSFLFLYFIYFLKDYRRGIDFLFLCGLLGIFVILNILGVGAGHYWFIVPLNLPWYLLLLVTATGVVAGGLIFWKLQKSIFFTKGRYKSVIIGKSKPYYKKIEDKIIIPLIFSMVTIISILFLITNFLWFNLTLFSVFYVSEIFLISAFAIWGLILFKKKPRGKPLYFWGLALLLLLFVGFTFNILILNNMIWQRILYLIPPIIVIGFVSYIYKLIKLNSIRMIKKKFLILFIVTFSLFATYFYESVAFEVFNLKNRDVSSIQWYSNNTSNKNVVITEFGWGHVFEYYSYPFEDGYEVLIYNGSDYFLKYEIDLFPPDNHINGSEWNILQEIKNEYNTDVYIIFADEYIINKGFELFGKLSNNEREKYYRLPYLNKIFSAKTEYGEETPLFWVI